MKIGFTTQCKNKRYTISPESTSPICIAKYDKGVREKASSKRSTPSKVSSVRSQSA